MLHYCNIGRALTALVRFAAMRCGAMQCGAPESMPLAYNPARQLSPSFACTWKMFPCTRVSLLFSFAFEMVMFYFQLSSSEDIHSVAFVTSHDLMQVPSLLPPHRNCLHVCLERGSAFLLPSCAWPRFISTQHTFILYSRLMQVDMMLQYDGRLWTTCTCFMFVNPTPMSDLTLSKWENNIVQMRSPNDQVSALEKANVGKLQCAAPFYRSRVVTVLTSPHKKSLFRRVLP